MFHFCFNKTAIPVRLKFLCAGIGIDLFLSFNWITVQAVNKSVFDVSLSFPILLCSA